MFIPEWADKYLDKPAKFTNDEIAEAKDPLNSRELQEAIAIEDLDQSIQLIDNLIDNDIQPIIKKREIITLKGKKNGRRR